MAIRTVYRNEKSNFYAVERAGFTTVSEAIYESVTNLLNHGFTSSSITYTDSNGLFTTGTWPIQETIYKTASEGIGYKIGDILEMQGGTYASSPLTLTVNTVDATTGAVKTYTITNTGDYDTPPTSPASMGAALTDTTFVGTITAINSVSAGGNAAPTTGTTTSEIPLAYADIPGTFNYPISLAGPTSPNHVSPENTAYKTAIPTTRQPTVVVCMLGAAPATVKVGQEVFGTGIPSGTVITTMRTFQLITSTAFVATLTGGNWNGATYNAGTASYRETTVTATYFVFSNPVTIDAGGVIHTRGAGMTINNADFKIPSRWTAIVEAGAAVDPLNDDVGIYANVTATTISSIYVNVGSIVGTKIYAGQLVVSTLEAGSISGVVTVVSVDANAITSISNVTLSSSQSFTTIDEQLHFIFPELQPWRVAFDVFNDQQVAVYAATPTQLTDTGNIARVTNDLGQVIDTAGAMGSMPTGGPLVTSRQGGGMVTGQVYAVQDYYTPPIPTNGGIGALGFATTWSDYVDLNEPYNITDFKNGQSGEYFTFTDVRSWSVQSYRPGTGHARHLDGTPWDGDATQGFVNRKIRVGDHPQAYPLNYAITISDHGLFFGLWEGTWSTLQRTMNNKRDNYFNWFVIQRPVDRFTGKTLTAGRAPVFCINCVGYKYWKFIVREADILHPSQGDQQLRSSLYNSELQAPVIQVTPFRVPADQHSEDSFAIINSSNQIALTEDSKYMVSFLHNLSTPRFRYSEELDMVGQTSADVCMSSNFISLTTYQESGPRQYRAMPANNKYNSGLRICILTDTPN